MVFSYVFWINDDFSAKLIDFDAVKFTLTHENDKQMPAPFFFRFVMYTYAVLYILFSVATLLISECFFCSDFKWITTISATIKIDVSSFFVICRKKTRLQFKLRDVFTLISLIFTFFHFLAFIKYWNGLSKGNFML